MALDERLVVNSVSCEEKWLSMDFTLFTARVPQTGQIDPKLLGKLCPVKSSERPGKLSFFLDITTNE